MATMVEPVLTDGPSRSAVEPALREEVRRTFRLALPIVGSTMSGMLLGFTDFLMVSRLGTAATAAISPCTMLLYSVLCLGLGMANSVQTYAAQSMGRRRPAEAAAYAWQSVYIGGVFVLIAYPVSRLMPLLWGAVGHEPTVQAMEVAYSQVVLWCMPPAIMCVGLEGFFNGIQRPKVALVSVLTAVGFNVLANYALIFGRLGMPEMGIRGAAVATLISWMIRLMMLGMVFLSREFRSSFRTNESWRPSGERIRAIIRLGGPTGIQWMLDVGSWFVFLTVLIAGFGTRTLAASNIALQMMHVSFMAALGIGGAVMSLVGHAIGEKKPELAAMRARAGLVLTMSYMAFIAVVFVTTGRHFVGLLSSDAEVITIGTHVLFWAAAFQIFDAMGITYVHALRGAGDTRWPSILVIICNWGVFITGGYLVSRHVPQLGYHGPWMMCTTYIILIGLALRWRFMRGAWRKIRLFTDDEPVLGGDVATAVCEVEQIGVGA
ncbi:MAG: MATE family efflux transporter [Planctomycetia bacterium]|nr:MATE family efflux transporter [Planctomycetia bacterium]MCC7313622.1 MATE family efflux transporter [Planctomycetota bacterium]